jgi:amidase
MGVQGPLARSAEDLELGFDVVAGAEIGEDVAWRLSVPPPRRERLADFRVAVLPPVDWVPVDGEIAAAQEQLVSRLARIGCQVAVVPPGHLGDHRAAFALYLTLLETITSAGLPPDGRRQRIEVLRTRDDEWTAALRRALESAAPDIVLWHGMRERGRAAWRAFFRDWDVVLAPAFFTPAFSHLERPWPATPESLSSSIEVDGRRVLYDLGLFYPAVATLPGHPATAFPVGLTGGGLPIGLQAIGPYLEDLTAIRFAALAAEELGGYVRPPGYDA